MYFNPTCIIKKKKKMMMRMIQRMTLHNSRLLKLVVHKEAPVRHYSAVQISRVEQTFLSKKMKTSYL